MKSRKRPYAVREWGVLKYKIEHQRSQAGNKCGFPFVELGCKITPALSKMNDAGKRGSQTFWPQSKLTQAGILGN